MLKCILFCYVEWEAEETRTSFLKFSHCFSSSVTLTSFQRFCKSSEESTP